MPTRRDNKRSRKDRATQSFGHLSWDEQQLNQILMSKHTVQLLRQETFRYLKTSMIRATTRCNGCSRTQDVSSFRRQKLCWEVKDSKSLTLPLKQLKQSKRLWRWFSSSSLCRRHRHRLQIGHGCLSDSPHPCQRRSYHSQARHGETAFARCSNIFRDFFWICETSNIDKNVTGTLDIK